MRVDFFSHPELVITAEHALKPALFEWTDTGCNTFADADNLLKISRAINLGNPNSTSTPNGMDARKAFLRKAERHWVSDAKRPPPSTSFVSAATASRALPFAVHCAFLCR